MIDIDFIGAAYEGRSRAIDSQRSINWYLETNDKGSRAFKTLAPTAGTKLFVRPAASKSRGMYAYDGFIFSVHGTTVYKTTQAGVTTALTPTLTTTTGIVSITDNGAQMMIVDGVGGFIYTKATGAFAAISDPDFPVNPVQAEHIDGYGLILEGGSGRFWISALNDLTSWNALDFATTEGSPDNLKAFKVINRRIWLFGDKSTEIWYNSGGKDFPFTRIPGSFFEEGIVAEWSVAKSLHNVFWLSNSERGDNMVLMTENNRPMRVSTMPIELDMDSYADTSDAIGFTFQEEGHTFYALTFPSGNKTWVYDTKEKTWHERSSDGNRWMVEHLTFMNEKHYSTDYRDGVVNYLSHEYSNENGSTIMRLRAGRHVTNNRDRVFISALEAVLEAGVGDSVTLDPQVMLRISKDGGFTWGSIKTRPAGKAGEYLKRVRFNKLGMARDYVFEISVSDDVQWHMVEVMAE